jgi:uncharacterized protein (DUF4415 family)
MADDWTKKVGKTRPAKVAITIRLDADVLAFFRAHGEGYQTWMNNVLRAYMDSQNGEDR